MIALVGNGIGIGIDDSFGRRELWHVGALMIALVENVIGIDDSFGRRLHG